MIWSKRAQRRIDKKNLEKANPDKIINSIKKSIARDKPIGLFNIFRNFFYKSPKRIYNEERLRHAKETFRA